MLRKNGLEDDRMVRWTNETWSNCVGSKEPRKNIPYILRSGSSVLFSMLVNEIILEHIFISDTQHFAQTAQSSKLTQIKHDSIQQRQGQVQCHHVTQFFITE